MPTHLQKKRLQKRLRMRRKGQKVKTVVKSPKGIINLGRLIDYWSKGKITLREIFYNALEAEDLAEPNSLGFWACFDEDYDDDDSQDDYTTDEESSEDEEIGSCENSASVSTEEDSINVLLAIDNAITKAKQEGMMENKPAITTKFWTDVEQILSIDERDDKTEDDPSVDEVFSIEVLNDEAFESKSQGNKWLPWKKSPENASGTVKRKWWKGATNI